MSGAPRLKYLRNTFPGVEHTGRGTADRPVPDRGGHEENGSAAQPLPRTNGSLRPYYNMYYKGRETGARNGSRKQKRAVDTARESLLNACLRHAECAGRALHGGEKSNAKSNWSIKQVSGHGFRKRMESFAPMEAFCKQKLLNERVTAIRNHTRCRIRHITTTDSKRR